MFPISVAVLELIEPSILGQGLHQSNRFNIEKKAGIKAIGGFLRMSRCMMVLWDPSYITRLWCVFELAAYVKLMKEFGMNTTNFRIKHSSLATVASTCRIANRKEERYQLRIEFLFLACMKISLLMGNALFIICTTVVQSVSTLLAVFSLLMCLGTAFVVVSLFLRTVKMMFLESMKILEQLNSFTLAKAQCFCCEVGHQHPDTQTIIACDRALVNHTIEGWFGSTEDFEHFVTSELPKAIDVQISVSYHDAVCIATPFLWQGFGYFAWTLTDQGLTKALIILWRRVSFALLVSPLVTNVVIHILRFSVTKNWPWIVDLFILTMVVTVISGAGMLSARLYVIWHCVAFVGWVVVVRLAFVGSIEWRKHKLW